MRVIILRGVPGSGKTTYARTAYPKATIVSADHYFEVTGEYKYNPHNIHKAHDACRQSFMNALLRGDKLIVVDNTNTRLWEMQYYLDEAKVYGAEIEVVRFTTPAAIAAGRNVHGVPEGVVHRMEGRFEDFPGEKLV